MICIGRYCIALYRYVGEDRTFGPYRQFRRVGRVGLEPTTGGL